MSFFVLVPGNGGRIAFFLSFFGTGMVGTDVTSQDTLVYILVVERLSVKVLTGRQKDRYLPARKQEEALGRS